MKNVKHFTQRYIDWVIKLGRIKFSLLGFLVLAIFALFTHIILSFLIVGAIHWESLSYAIIFGLISAPFVIYFFTVLVERLELSRQALEKSIQDKSNLMATISHELRTPLNGILGLSRMLLDTPLNDQQRNYLNTISVSAVSLGHIFNDIIDLEKIDSSRIELYKRETNFHRFLADIQNIASLLTEQKGLKFLMKCGENLPQFLRFDSTRLSQILWNLLSNAVKFTEKGEITLTVAKVSPTKYTFSVQDTGQGMPPEELDKIFAMYYQIEHNVAKPAGSGIGLAISKNIAHLMNGDLTVSSRLGQGSTFTLMIEADSVDKPILETEQSAVQNLHILLVEDIQLNVVVAKALLEKLGHQVDVAMSGQAAISAFEQKNYDLLLLDIQLPDMTGFDIACYLRDGYENGRYDYLPPLIALTANVMQSKAEYQAQGIDDVLRKPLLANELASCLANYFDFSETDSLPNDNVSEKSAVNFSSKISPPKSLSVWFNIEILAELIEFIGTEVYAQNLNLFQQAINGGELDLVSAYQQYLRGEISKAELAEIAHKLKGAAASLAMQKVQQTANLAQQENMAEWEEQIEKWVADIAQDSKESLSAIKNWLAS
ncbi:hybrid sensor histidine kinase/response regulator [Pasteurellaceae bacterium Pebbles2]|nr:hybrid sensor histidine kinase/response regulator [Pasteurellaceae bacterium Pebbles2]